MSKGLLQINPEIVLKLIIIIQIFFNLQCQANNSDFTQLKLFVIPSVSDRIFWLCLAFVLDSFGEFYKNRSSDRELWLCQHLRVRGQACGRGEGAGRVKREEPTDAFSSIREEFCSTRRIEPP